MRQVVKVGVVGAHDRRVQIDPAIARAVPVAIFVVVVRQLVIARVKHPSGCRDDATVEPGDSNSRFDRRTRRVQATQNTVEQGPVNGVPQLGIGFKTDAGDKQVRVETRLTDHRQHFASTRIKRDHRTATPGQCNFGGFLQFDVEAQDDVFAWRRIGALEHTQYSPAGVGFNFFVAHLTMQLRLVETLDAGFADMVGAAVIDRVEHLELFLVDPPHVTHRVREVRTLRIVANQLRNHLNAGQTELVDGNAGNLLFSQLKQNGHRLEWPSPLLHALFEQHPIIRRQFQHADNDVQHLLPVARTLAGHAQAETGPIIGDDHPIAVVDQPTGWRNRLNMNPVVLRQGRVILVLDDLQEIQPRNQHAHQHHHRHSPDHDSAAH